ncbi:MAG: SDR family oxidoreductase [Thermodesulfobacteriota bacterium]
MAGKLSFSETLIITGANGFIGRAVCAEAAALGYRVRTVVRTAGRAEGLPSGVETFPLGDIGPQTDWRDALAGGRAVIHLAARVHQVHDPAPDPLAAHRAVNLDGTIRLAQAAAAQGLKRLVFLSSVKVNGEGRDRPYTEADRPAPADPYGLSKWEAEQALSRLASENGLEVAILRPPLVYGPGVKANFLRLLEMVKSGLPLPLASVNNRRGLLFLGNLVSAILACLNHPEAAGRTYLVSDGEDVSSPELIRRLARVMKRPARLLPCPPLVLRWAGRIMSRTDEVERLLGSLAVDDSLIRRELGWNPPYTLDQGLQETVEWFLSMVPE